MGCARDFLFFASHGTNSRWVRVAVALFILGVKTLCWYYLEIY